MVELKAVNDGVLPYGNGLYVHGMFFNLLREENEQMCEVLHNKDEIKPYTLSAIKGDKIKNWQYPIDQEQSYFLKASFMDRSLFKVFYDAVYSYILDKKVVRVGKIDFVIKDLRLKEVMSIEELKNKEWIQNNKFGLEFISPTSFRVLGKNYLFPDTKHIFKSYIKKWNAFVDRNEYIDEKYLENIEESCFCIRHKLHTELMNMGKYKIVGFKGKCYYEIESKGNEELKMMMNKLIGFSNFCGTGYKTTMGMGETRVIK